MLQAFKRSLYERCFNADEHEFTSQWNAAYMYIMFHKVG